MSSIGLNTGLRALLSSRLALDTIGHNLANAGTAGFSRQSVNLTSGSPVFSRGVFVGSGVNATHVSRNVDQMVRGRLAAQMSLSQSLFSRAGGFDELQALFGEPGDSSLGSRIDGLFSSLSDLSTAPDDPILRTGLVQSTLELTSQFNQLTSQLGTFRADTEAQVSSQVDQVNNLAGRIAELNVQIGEAESTGLAANDMRDQRDLAVQQLSEVVEVRTIEDPNGTLRVLLEGNTLVSSNRAQRLQVERDNNNQITFEIEGSSGSLSLSGGRIGGLLELNDSYVPGVDEQLDELARNMILEINRLHSTGINDNGPFTSLVGDSRVQDLDSDGSLNDELLSRSGLPFDIADGVLRVNVTELETGAFDSYQLEIDASHTTVEDFVSALNSIPELSAGIDTFGRLRIDSGTGFGFDFSSRLDPNPDAEGTFGGGKASLGTVPGPFGLADGDTLQLTVDPNGAAVPLTISFAAADFIEISQATADEIASVINADPGASASGITATSVNDQLFLQSAGTGASAEYRLDGGSSVAALGLTGFTGTTLSGSENEVGVEISGNYTGTGNGVFTFSPSMDGTIGTTPNLFVDVVAENGDLVATLNVGAGYVPGTELDVAEGITATFGLGELSATEGDVLQLEVTEDSDTSDVLVALGLNSFLTGSGAADIGVRADIERDPQLLSLSSSGAAGDSSLLLELLDAENLQADGLSGRTFGGFYGEIIGDLGFQASSANNALDANTALIASLQARSDQVSGVNVDEELVDLLQYEQSFAAAAQFITVINQLNDELLSLI